MPFQLLPAVPADAEEISRIFVACSTSPRILLESGNVDRAEYAAWHYREVLGSLSVEDPNIVRIKLVDEDSGKIAAFAQWGFTPHAWQIEQQFKKPNPYPRGTNTVLRTRFSEGMKAMGARNKPDEAHHILMNLATAPEFQRRGAGRTLVKYGLERADKDGIITRLDGSPSGVPLYRTLGFEEVDRLEIPLEEFGGEGKHVHGKWGFMA
ncbi:MAG: hypothetical protein M1818_003834 [Claussenomyces sp. TS43310]|nr:MAG: hypothetical protein M1818_003834 [Claussenomyces sp. TS43310]